MAVHQESRQTGLKAFPHTVTIDTGSYFRHSVVRFNKHHDVVHLDHIDKQIMVPGYGRLPGFSENIIQAAIDGEPYPHGNDDVDNRVSAALCLFPGLKRPYIWRENCEYKTKDLRWTVSDCVHQYHSQTSEKEFGLGENTESMICWPNLSRHSDFAKFQVPRVQSEWPLWLDRDIKRSGVEIWPCIVFQFEPGMAMYRRLLRGKHLPYGDAISDSSDEYASMAASSFDGTDQDEYESEGIDDAAIVTDEDSSEEDLISDQVSEAAGARFSTPELESQDGRGGRPARR